MIVKPGLTTTKTCHPRKAGFAFPIRLRGAVFIVLPVLATAAPALACKPSAISGPVRIASVEPRPDDPQYRYSVTGGHRRWTYAGVQRLAGFNDLPPGQYSIEVVVCRPDEPCVRTPAKITLTTRPPWFNTWWVRWAGLVALIVAAGALFEWRMRSLACAARLRFEARLAERTRVARDLHDTLMQTVLASKVMADTSRQETDAARLQATMSRLSSSLGQAAQEGRAAVETLRPPGQDGVDLAAALELAALDGRYGAGLEGRVTVSGKRQALHPMVQQETLKIGYEAIRNACIHSMGRHLRIHLAYDSDLILTVEDDGKGLLESVIANGRPGHFGLVGMRERAEHMGGTLKVSNLHPGVRVRLCVPGSTAFVRRQGRSAGLRALKAFFNRTAALESRRTQEGAAARASPASTTIRGRKAADTP
jgi:signal transduction histidine kinase